MLLGTPLSMEILSNVSKILDEIVVMNVACWCQRGKYILSVLTAALDLLQEAGSRLSLIYNQETKNH